MTILFYFLKGLSFCPKIKSHDKIKLAEELFKYTRWMRLKEFFFEPDKNKDISEKRRQLFWASIFQ